MDRAFKKEVIVILIAMVEGQIPNVLIKENVFWIVHFIIT